VVLKALSEFAHIFSWEPQRKHFAEYLTGLMIAKVAYSLLVRELRHLPASDWAFQKLKTIGEVCRPCTFPSPK